MLHKAFLAVAVWFIVPAVHAQYTIMPMISLLMEEVALAEQNDLYATNKNATLSVPISITSNAYKHMPLDVLKLVVRWHKDGNNRAAKAIGWYANGQQAIVLHTRRSALHGEWQTWYQNGQQRDAGNFVLNTPHGEWKSWYANGKLHSIRQYDAHKMQMVEIAIRQRNPKLAFHPISQEAIKHPEKLQRLLSPGAALVGADKNATAYEFPFAACFHHGFFANYFENGSMQQSGFYKDGQKDGLWMQWNPTGNMVASGYYQNGMLHGAKKDFDATGHLQKMTEYKQGKKVHTKVYSN